MNAVSIGSFNVENLIGPDREYYRFERYSAADYAAKADWLAGQIVAMGADVIGFQEVFEEAALRDVLARVQARAPGAGYGRAALAFAQNWSDKGRAGHRAPGVAIVSRPGFAAPPEIVQHFDPPLEIAFSHMGSGDAGHFTLTRTARPILKVRVPMGGHVVTVFTCHLKSKLGEFAPHPDTPFAAEANLLEHDPMGRALGQLRATLRRMAEAWVLRGAVLAELEQGHPVIVTGDFNDGPGAVSTRIVLGEVPRADYATERRHDATRADETYTRAQADRIHESIDVLRLHRAEALAPGTTDDSFTASFRGTRDSIDQILLSRHFRAGAADSMGEVTRFDVLNDHLCAPGAGTGLTSDHGQIVAHLRLNAPTGGEKTP